jgi:hypothetical protein
MLAWDKPSRAGSPFGGMRRSFTGTCSGQSPLQRNASAARVFHFDCNATEPAIFYLDIHLAVQALISGVLCHSHCAAEEALATKVFHRRCYHSASMLFHTLVLAFPLVVAPGRFHARIEIQLTRSVGFDLLNSEHSDGLVEIRPWLTSTGAHFRFLIRYQYQR